MRKKLIITGMVVGIMGIAGTAMAATPGGTSETGNQVECGAEGTRVGTTGLYVIGLPDPTAPPGPPDPNGAIVVCNEPSAVTQTNLVQGRIIGSGSGGSDGLHGYAAADGDKDNNENATGYIRVNGDVGPPPPGETLPVKGSVQCGGPTTDTDAGNPATRTPGPGGPAGIDNDCDPR